MVGGKPRAVAERPRARLAALARTSGDTRNAADSADEQAALTAARLFTDYLRACRDERFAMSLLPPGRFLMPGNLALAGADLCAARSAGRRRGARGIAVGDDAAAL